MTFLRVVLCAQAIVYLATGVWSVVSRSTFERVTGPKTDYWLVRMVGLLAAVIGASLIGAVRATAVGGSTLVLGIGSALAFAAIDIRYVVPRRISRIYLLDAVFELIVAAALGVAWVVGK